MFISTFFQELTGTLTSVQYYWRIRTKPLLQSFGFLVTAYTLIIAPLITWQTLTTWLPAWHQTLTATVNEAITHFPQNREISWDTRRISLNPTEAWQIAYPTTFKLVQTPQTPQALAYFSNQDSFPVDPSQVPSVWFVITNTELWISNPDGQWSSLPLTEVPLFDHDFVLNSQTLPSWQAAITAKIDQVFAQLAWIAPIVLVVGLLLVRIWAGLLHTLFLFFLVRLNGWSWKFTHVWNLVLHLTVAGEVLAQLARLLYGPSLTINIFGLTIWMGSIFILLHHYRSRPVITG